MKKIISILIITFLLMFVSCKDNFKHETLKKGNNEEVDVYLLLGQSNASGYTKIQYLKEKSIDTYNIANFGFSNVYINSCVEGKLNTKGFVNVTLGQGTNAKCFGPEIGISMILQEKTQKSIIIKYSYGGTNLYHDWNINEKNNLFIKMIAFVNSSLNHLKDKGYSPKVKATFFMQGESDAFDHALEYEDHLVSFIENIRKEYGDIFFVDALISDSSVWKNHKIINEAKRNASLLSNKNLLVDTISCQLSYQTEPKDNVDLCHYDSLGMIELGKLFINTYLETQR